MKRTHRLQAVARLAVLMLPCSVALADASGPDNSMSRWSGESYVAFELAMQDRSAQPQRLAEQDATDMWSSDLRSATRLAAPHVLKPRGDLPA